MVPRLFDFEERREMAKKIGRNDPCPCGSGRKYKDCCMRKDRAKVAENSGTESPYLEPGWITALDWHPPVRAAAIHFAEVLERIRERDETGDQDYVEAYKGALDRLSQAMAEARMIKRERQELAPRPDRIESIDDLEMLIKALPTFVRSELGPHVSHWQRVIWPNASPQALEDARVNMSDAEMRWFLRALAEQDIDRRVRESPKTDEPYIPPSAEKLREWSEALAIAAPQGYQGKPLEDFRMGRLQRSVREMSVEEMHAFVRRSRETMSEEEIEEHLQGYSGDLSEEELREFVLDFADKFIKMAHADRERRGSLKKIEDLTTEVTSMTPDEISQLVRANIELDPPLVRRRHFLWTLVAQKGKGVSEGIEFVANEIKSLSPEQKCERILELFEEKVTTSRHVTGEDILEFSNNPIYHMLLEELKVIPLDTLGERLFEVYWTGLMDIRGALSKAEVEPEVEEIKAAAAKLEALVSEAEKIQSEFEKIETEPEFEAATAKLDALVSKVEKIVEEEPEV